MNGERCLCIYDLSHTNAMCHSRATLPELFWAQLAADVYHEASSCKVHSLALHFPLLLSMSAAGLLL